MADEPDAKRARDTRESDRETYELGYLLPLSGEKWKCVTKPLPTTFTWEYDPTFPDYGELGSDHRRGEDGRIMVWKPTGGGHIDNGGRVHTEPVYEGLRAFEYHDYRKLGETDYTALLAIGTEDRPRGWGELRIFWHLQDFVSHAHEFLAGRDSLDLRRPANLHTSVLDMESPVIEFCEGFKYGCNDEALQLMMRHTHSFEEIAITKDTKHFLHPTENTEKDGICGKSSFDNTKESNLGWLFFKTFIVKECMSMIQTFKDTDFKQRDKGTKEKAQVALNLCAKAMFYLSQTTNLEKIFKQQLPQALVAAGQHAAQTPKSVAVTCFYQTWALVCSLDTKSCVPISWLIARPTASFRTVAKSDCVDLPTAELGEAYATLQGLLKQWLFDETMRTYVLKSLAAITFGLHPLKQTKVIFLHITSADSGKSFFLKMLQEALGDAYSTPVGSELLKSKASEAAAGALKKKVSGLRLAWFDELESGPLNLGLLKKVFTSGVDQTSRTAGTDNLVYYTLSIPPLPILPIPAIPYAYPTHISKPLTSNFSIPNPTLQVTYESGCAPWICANYAQLPKQPEPDVLKKIVFIGEFDSQGNRLLGTFVNTKDAKPKEGIFNKDERLASRINNGDFSAPMIRILYEHLDTAFSAEEIPESLRALREQWPLAVPDSLEPELQVQLVDALSTLLQKTDGERQWVLRREIYAEISEYNQELWLKMETRPWKKGALFNKVRAAKLSFFCSNPHPTNPNPPHSDPLFRHILRSRARWRRWRFATKITQMGRRSITESPPLRKGSSRMTGSRLVWIRSRLISLHEARQRLAKDV